MALSRVTILGFLDIFILLFLGTSTASIYHNDISCLKSIKNSLEDPYSYLSSSWNFNNNTDGFICKFPGVDCWNPDENRVLSLRLSNMRLKGQFPRGIENCTSLTGLDLSDNEMQGPIPFDIGQMLRFVTSLDLSSNNFSGEIPSSIANCSYLNVLKLDHNHLIGDIPQQIGQLERIRAFSVANNLLSGPVPSFVNVNFSGDSCANNTGLCGGPLRECIEPGTGKKVNWKVIGCVVFAVLVVVVLACSVPWVYVGKRKKKTTVAAMIISLIQGKNRKMEDDRLGGLPSIEALKETEISMLEKFVTRMNYTDLSNATNSFGQQNIIGLGQMGTMYKAKLPNGWFLAVKKLDYSQQLEEQFMTELKTLGRLRHDNLATLLGFCIESKERLLVYKYISNGNLYDWLHSTEDKKNIFDWHLRVKIALGLARGLAWLHHGCNICVAHLNLCSKCVLLDKDFEPKLSNFGMAALINPNDVTSNRRLCVDTKFWELSFVKADVFNFGILLFELITGKEPTTSNCSEGSLDEWISQLSAGSACLYDAIDKSLTGKELDDEIFQLFRVACNCIEQFPERRPTMQDAYERIRAIEERHGLTYDQEKCVQSEITALNVE